MPYRYHKVFDPPLIQSVSRDPTDTASKFGDEPERLVYMYTEKAILAVNIAMVTGRPLLVRGPPGSGKTSLAPNVARFKNWRYYKEVISSRAQASDLQWRFDALRRLNDAQASRLQPDAAYVTPGVLWWAFDPEGAKQWEARRETLSKQPTPEPALDTKPVPAVVLLDEIDKAEPDVPNDLLEVLGIFQ